MHVYLLQSHPDQFHLSVCIMPVPISPDIPDLYSVSLIPSLIPRQHESEPGLIPRLSSPACEVGMRPDRFISQVHRIQAHALQKYMYVGCFNHRVVSYLGCRQIGDREVYLVWKANRVRQPKKQLL